MVTGSPRQTWQVRASVSGWPAAMACRVTAPSSACGSAKLLPRSWSRLTVAVCRSASCKRSPGRNGRLATSTVTVSCTCTGKNNCQPPAMGHRMPTTVVPVWRALLGQNATGVCGQALNCKRGSGALTRTVRSALPLAGGRLAATNCRASAIRLALSTLPALAATPFASNKPSTIPALRNFIGLTYASLRVASVAGAASGSNQLKQISCPVGQKR